MAVIDAGTYLEASDADEGPNACSFFQKDPYIPGGSGCKFVVTACLSFNLSLTLLYLSSPVLGTDESHL